MNRNRTKLAIFPIIVFSFSILGCNPSNGSSSISSNTSDTSSQNSSDTEPNYQTISFHVNADYGMHIANKVTLLLGDSLIPFKLEEYNIDTLVIGDYVTIQYTGTLLIRQSYPSTITFEDGGGIVNVSVVHGHVYEFVISDNPGGGQSIRPLSYGSFIYKESDYCVKEDGSFVQAYSLPIRTKLYGINPAYYNSNNIEVFYTYNPLPDNPGSVDN